MRIAILCLAMSLCVNLASADESCQGFMDQIAARLAAVDKMSSLDRAAKCRAYELIALDAGGVVTACSHSQEEANLVKSRYRSLMEPLAKGQQTFCSR